MPRFDSVSDIAPFDPAASLAAARAAAGLSQRGLAARTGVSQPTIARIETGRVDPRVGTLVALLEACGVGLTGTDGREEAGRAAEPLTGRSPDDRLAWALVARVEAAAPDRPSPFDPATVLRLLTDHEVAFVVAGEVADLLRGAPTVPDRLDVRCRWDDENRRRLAGVLRILSATPVDARDPVLWDGPRLADRPDWLLDTRAGALQLRGVPPRGFDRLRRDTEAVVVAETEVPLAPEP